MATKKTPAAEEQQIAEFQAHMVMAVQAAVAEAFAPLTARIALLEQQVATLQAGLDLALLRTETQLAAPATTRVGARQQPAGLNRFEQAKLAINKAAGREPHAFVKREAIDAWLAEHA